MSSKNDPRPHLSLWVPVVIYMGAIFYVSSLSNPPIPSGTDKPLHWLAYLGLAVVVVRARAGGLPRRIGFGVAATAMLITVGYGATDEVHQLFVPGRSADLYDLMADAGGALAGTVGCWVWGLASQGTRHKAQSSSHNARRQL
jgi:VanZ family protein